MARVHHLASSRVEHQCHRGHTIPAGEGYSWAAPGFRARKRFACKRHPFRPSQLTVGLVSEALAAAESFEEALDAIDSASPEALDELETAKGEFEEEIRGYAEQRQEALDAWENGNSQLEELSERAEAALSEIEGWDPQEWDGYPEVRDDEDHEDHEEALGSWIDHVDEQIEAARELTGLDF